MSNVLVSLPRLIQLELMEANQMESQPILTWLLLTVSALHHERHGDGSHGDGHHHDTNRPREFYVNYDSICFYLLPFEL